jgi:hypothetical protein
MRPKVRHCIKLRLNDLRSFEGPSLILRRWHNSLSLLHALSVEFARVSITHHLSELKLKNFVDVSEDEAILRKLFARAGSSAVERRLYTPLVAGSIPVPPTKFNCCKSFSWMAKAASQR